MWWWTALAWASPDVVMVGNSYMMRNDLAGQLQARLDEVAASGVTPRTLDLARGGYTWSQHLARLDTDAVFQVAFGEPRDLVILQEQSQTPGFPQTDPSWLASERAGEQLDAAARAVGATTVLMNTWGHARGDEDNPGLAPDYLSMQDNVDAGYVAYQAQWEAASGVRPVRAPVGDAWRAVYELGGDGFLALFEGDGSHPTAAGSFLASHVLTAALTGRRAIGGGDALPEAVRAQLAEIAAGVVFDDPFGPDAYAWAHDWADWPAAEAISGAWFTPWVRIRTPATIDALTVGALHPEGAGEGRVVVDAGASVVGAGPWRVGADGHGVVDVRGGDAQIGRVVLGELAESLGELVVSGGRIQVDVLDRGLGEGAVTLTGGELALTGSSSAPIRVEGGALVLDGAQTLGGDLVQSGGSVALLGASAVTVGGVVTLGGELIVGDAAGAVLIEADAVDAGAVVAVDAAGAPVAVEVVDVAGGQQLVRAEGGAGETPDGSPEGCGCDGVGGRGALASLAVVLLARRRRR